MNKPVQKQKAPQTSPDREMLSQVRQLAEKISRATNRETGKAGFSRKPPEARTREIGYRSYSAFILTTLRDFPERATTEKLNTALTNLRDMERILLASNPNYFGAPSEFKRFHGREAP